MASRHTKGRLRRQGKQAPNGQLVHIEFSNPLAHRVCIAGTFNNWEAEAGKMDPLGDGTWAADLALKPGTYEYRFVVDGKWMPDPQAEHSIVNRFGERNSLLSVP